MSDDRPLTRKTRRRLDRAARDRLIAEIAAAAPDEYPPARRDDIDLSEEAAEITSDDAGTVELGEAAQPLDPEGTTPAEPSRESPRESDRQDQDTAPPAPSAEPLPMPGRSWPRLASIPVDAGHLERNLIITATRHDPAHGAFDVLRTRLVRTLAEHDWKRVAITSPTRDCGKTFTAVNLAISLSRYETHRTILMDMDMRNPSVATVLGVDDPGSIGNFLRGRTGVTEAFKRLGRNALNIGTNLAVAMNERVESYAAELLQAPETAIALSRMMDELDPDIVLYDLPPALAFDDVIAFKDHFDGILMIIGGGQTRPDEVHEAMRRIGEDVPLLGVVLNQAEADDAMAYSYGY
ncbi:CpsD/CapB family tyrosine-protein kinase [Aquicoccus sp.]|uniref:CpsD/CapB family tyrosine-protein kinase n=1 Tax=Aquicoccus sp. TaxID=2055851 RepID=UPI003566127B